MNRRAVLRCIDTARCHMLDSLAEFACRLSQVLRHSACSNLGSQLSSYQRRSVAAKRWWQWGVFLAAGMDCIDFLVSRMHRRGEKQAQKKGLRLNV